MTDFVDNRTVRCMRIRLLVGVTIIALITLGGWLFLNRSSITAPAESLETVRIANLPVVQGLPVYLALEKGYFKEAGINVELISFAAPNQLIDAVLEGRVDMTSPSAANGIVSVAESKYPGKLRVYAFGGGDLVTQNDAILVKASSTLTTLQNLKGKRLGIVAGSIQWRTIAQYILKQNGLEADKDVQLIELALGVQAQALESGQIDALLGIEPMPTIVKASGIGKELVSHVTARFVSTPFYAGAGVVSTQFSHDHPTTTQLLLDVLKRSIDEINQNPEAARRYLKAHTSLRDAALSSVPISHFAFHDELTPDDIRAIQQFYDIFPAMGVVDRPVRVEDLL